MINDIYDENFPKKKKLTLYITLKIFYSSFCIFNSLKIFHIAAICCYINK